MYNTVDDVRKTIAEIMRSGLTTPTQLYEICKDILTETYKVRKLNELSQKYYTYFIGQVKTRLIKGKTNVTNRN